MSIENPQGIQNSLFPDASKAVYEQPLSERIRSFLRLEYLFTLINSTIDTQSEWASRITLETIIDITDVLTRTDIKAELIKEIDRQSVVLSRLQSNPGVDHSRLKSTISSLQNLLSRLHSSECQPGQTVRKDELIASIRQRLTIPGGTCSFDLPGYHYWLSKPGAQRNAQLQHWLADLRIMQDGIAVILGVVRESASPTQVTANSGFFQQPLDTDLSYHMVRVLLPADSPFYPEISAGRHRFTIRFLEQKNTLLRPSQTDADVYFELERCVF